MLCRSCRRQVPRGAAYCSTCGARTRRGRGGEEPLELVLRDGTRVPVSETVTIGRAPDNTIRLDDPSVSRHHATVVVNGGSPPQIVDTGSRAGTILNGRKLSTSAELEDGTTIQLGNSLVRVERRRADSEAGRTVVVRAGSTVLVPVAGLAQVENATAFGFKPKLRSGWALKRLDASEGEKRFVLHDLRGGGFARMGADEAAILELLDGEHSLVELITEAERRIGPRGAGTVASLLAELGERGYLAGIEGSGSTAAHGRLRRLLEPRNFTVSWLGPLFERIYRRGGFLFFARPAVALLGAVAVGGLAVWIYLVAGRYGTPFVVAEKVGLGGLVFLLGRFVVVAVHEVAHGLTVSSFGRRVPRAGLKLMLVFPYAFVDTSEAWFEPRRRRLAISGAGPVSDFVVGGLFSLAALPSGDGALRDIFFNLAFAAYVGAFFNLNPFLERDGYHMLVDLMREPGLRRRSRQWLVGILAGRGRAAGSERHSRLFEIYGVTSVLWLFSGLLFALIGTKRLYPRLVDVAPRPAVWAGFAVVYLLALLPVAIVIGRPLLQRWREAPEVVEHAEA